MALPTPTERVAVHLMHLARTHEAVAAEQVQALATDLADEHERQRTIVQELHSELAIAYEALRTVQVLLKKLT